MGLAVSFLLRHNVDYVLRTCFLFACHLVDQAYSIHFFITQLCKTLNFLELGGEYKKRVKLHLDYSINLEILENVT